MPMLTLMIAALLAPCGRAWAGTGIDPSVVVERHVRHYVVEPDGTYRLTVDDVRTIAGRRAVRDQGRFAIRYSRSLDEIVAVEAYTQKPGGQRVPVPPEGIRDDAAADAHPAHPSIEARARTVVFRDVTIGDQLVVHYVVRRHTPALRAQFEDLAVMSSGVHRHTMLVYDMPASMPLHADAVGFASVPGDSPPGRRRYQWRYQGGQASGDNGRGEPDADPDAVSVVDDGRRLAVSTLADYPALAAAIRAATAGKALPSPAIATLAQRLTAGLPDTRARVLALSEQVRNHIRHVGTGTGAVLPHPAGTVLDTRRGDGNDHAVLLEALLAAAGIASTPALVNGGNAYRLPAAPVLGVLDHMIVYVPGLDLFVDPAATSVKAGYLPPALLGKPALLLRTGTFAMTPVLQPQTIRSAVTVDIGRDGRGSFRGYRTVSGALAEPLRGMARAMAYETAIADRERTADRMPHDAGQRARAMRDVRDATAPGSDRHDGHDAPDDTYTMTLSGAGGDTGDLLRQGTLATTCHAWSVVDAAVASLARERERHHDFVCAAVDAEDEIRLRLPQSLRFALLPRPASVIAGGIFYQTTYARKGDAVLVRRRLTFRHGRATCTPLDARAMRPALDRIRRDLRSRIVVAAGGSAAGLQTGVAGKGVPPPAGAQRGHGLVRKIKAQVDPVAPRTVAGGPAGDLDEAAALEEAGRMRMRIHRHIAGPQLASGHVQ
jgi:transglutaminase-like putative cysteine protease